MFFMETIERGPCAMHCHTGGWQSTIHDVYIVSHLVSQFWIGNTPISILLAYELFDYV